MDAVLQGLALLGCQRAGEVGDPPWDVGDLQAELPGADLHGIIEAGGSLTGSPEMRRRWLKGNFNKNLNISIADIRNPFMLEEAVKGVDMVYHFAAQVAVTTSFDDPEEDFDINARGTLNLLNALRKLPTPPPLLYTSTNKVYGDRPNALPLVELAEPGDPAILLAHAHVVGDDAGDGKAEGKGDMKNLLGGKGANLAEMTAIVANGGRKVIPHLIQGADLPEPEHVALDENALRIVREGLWAVVNEPGGTAYWRARVPGAEMAGKTGTVQVIAQSARTEAKALPFKFRDHAWFTSFAPAQDPEIVVVVFAEHGGSGSGTAAPIAQALHAKYFKVDLQHPADR